MPALVERNRRTTLTLTTRYDSREVLDAVPKSGATDGVDVSYEHLDAVLAALATDTGRIDQE